MTTPTTPDVFKREQLLKDENRRLRALLADVLSDLESCDYAVATRRIQGAGL